jgi:hypothetical protein
VIQVRLFVGGDNSFVAFVLPSHALAGSVDGYPYLESITDFRESVSSGSARQPRGAGGRFISGDVGAAEVPGVTVGLYNRENELWNLVGLLRRTPLHVLVDDETLFSGLVVKQTLGSTMVLEASA